MIRSHPMLSRYDYIVIAFYFVFMTLMSWVMKRFVRNTSDYFRGGGEMLWWMAGAGAFTVSFSAVKFTGMAGRGRAPGEGGGGRVFVPATPDLSPSFFV